MVKAMKYKEKFQIIPAESGSHYQEKVFSFVVSYIKNAFKNMFHFSKSEKVTLLVFVAAWSILGVLKAMQIEPGFLKPLAFLTSAYNGLEQGIVPILGGITAKGITFTAIAGGIVPSITNLFSKHKVKSTGAFSNLISAMKKIKQGGLKSLSAVAIGSGGALILYNFLSVNGQFQNNFVSILAVYAVAKDLGNENAFLFGVLQRTFKKTPLFASHFSLGLVLGYTLSVPVSLYLASVAGIGYLLGGALMVLGILLSFAGKKRGEV